MASFGSITLWLRVNEATLCREPEVRSYQGNLVANFGFKKRRQDHKVASVPLIPKFASEQTATPLSNTTGRNSMLDHVIVTVSDFTRSIAFYAQALKPLGITDFLDYKGQDGHPDLKGFGNDGRFFFWLKEGRPNPDAVHFGFVAKSHAEVNAFFVAAIAAGGREKTAPAPQLQYHPDYYATWVLDPDGHDVEVVNKTGQID
jgi:catechol 2,3-dioxygenase-like lactoylglutathione lyase family enzyme